MSDNSKIVLELKNVTQIFAESGVRACHDISMQVQGSEILAVMGENGAGKSTLMFLISGFMEPGRGEILCRGGKNPADLRALVGMVHQKPLLAGDLSVLENIILGPEKGLFRKDVLKEEIAAVQERYNLPLDLHLKAKQLTAPQIQRCELIRALWKNKELLILDEPTASLSTTQSEELFELLLRLKGEGKTVIFISHKIHEVMKVADRIAVIRRGELQGIDAKGNLSPREISRLMIGEDTLPGEEPAAEKRGEIDRTGVPVLELSNLGYSETGTRRLDSINLSLYPGEILGMGGIRENGLTHVEDILCGLEQPDTGFILLNGKNRMPLTPLKLRRSGISYIPADRLKRGAAPESTLAENLSVLKRQAGFGSYRKRLFSWAGQFISDHAIKGEAKQKVKTLSGGNIQKMIVARELENNPPLLIVSEPSWGLDFKSRDRLHSQLVQAREEGIAILLLTTDLDELLSLSDRICVLTEGRLTEIERTEEQWNRYYIGEKMTGADRA